MKKVYTLLSLILAVTAFAGCNNGKQESSADINNNTQTQSTTQAINESTTETQPVAEQSNVADKRDIGDINNTNQNITVREIDTIMIKEEYLDQMIQDGVYALDDGKQLAVVFVNKKGYEYDTEVYANGTDVYVHYETEISDDIEPRIDDDAYLINGYSDNVMIKIYKDGQETEFASVIPCENIFK